MQTFSDIRVPALALCAIPTDRSTALTEAESVRDAALREARATAFEQNVAGARVVRVPHANHYIFLSHEADVLDDFLVIRNGYVVQERLYGKLHTMQSISKSVTSALIGIAIHRGEIAGVDTKALSYFNGYRIGDDPSEA